MARTGFYAGSFDPPTLGHVDIATRALRLVDRLVVGVGSNADKRSWIDVDTRLALLAACLPAGVEVLAFSGLAVAAARQAGATLLLRGLRSEDDAASELAMARANGQLDGGIETVMLAAGAATSYVSSRLVREVHRSGGDLTPFVPAAVAACLSDPRWKAS